MAAHAALLLASALLACQGLALSRRTPGRCGLGPAFWCRDLATAHLCAAEELCQGLVPDGPQGDMLTPQEAQVSCWACKKIIQKLQNLVGDQPSQETINQAASRVCSRMGVLKGSCRRILKSFLRRISTDIMEGKDARAICVDLKMCSPQGGCAWRMGCGCRTQRREGACGTMCGSSLALTHSPCPMLEGLL